MDNYLPVSGERRLDFAYSNIRRNQQRRRTKEKSILREDLALLEFLNGQSGNTEYTQEVSRFHRVVLRYIGDDPVLRQNLFLQGGGAVFFFYGSSKPTSDLDFVSTRLDRKLVNKLTGYFRSHTGVQFNLEEGGDYVTITYTSDGRRLGRVEITSQTGHDCIRSDGVQVLTKTELLTDKIATLYHRFEKYTTVSETDAFFILYLLRLGARATPGEIKKKARNMDLEVGIKGLMRA